MSSPTRRFLLLLAVLLLLALVCLILSFAVLPGLLNRITPPKTAPTQTPAALGDAQQAFQEALQEAISIHTDQPVFAMFDTRIENMVISSDSNWAMAELMPLDPETGEVIPAEPGLALAVWDGTQWQTVLPSDPGWGAALLAAPPDMLSPEERTAWLEIAAAESGLQPDGPLGGYLLPWKGGDTMRLTQSVRHDRYTPSGSAHFAFDFATPGYPSTLFNIHAAKGGFVTRAVWSHPNGSEGAERSNFIVLEDRSTSPFTYQLYLHLAQNSIPEELRQPGAFVQQGEFLGVADDTGVSSGNHLHFQVHTNPNSYWGVSVDITFIDVDINGGRPRISSDLSYCKSSDVCAQTQNDYRSQNSLNPDFNPPSGDILEPLTGAVISSPTVALRGTAADDNSGIQSAQFLARFPGNWQMVEPGFTQNEFSLTWDVCADGIADGPLSLALQIRDNAYNQTPGLPGLQHFTKNFTCPTPAPACSPDANQVALFAEPAYSGACVTLGIGSFDSSALGSLGSNNAASLLVGDNVQATLFLDGSFKKRAETFTASNSNLSDNLIGSNTTSSVIVQSRTTGPLIPAPLWPANGAALNTDATFNLTWENSGGAIQYMGLLNGPLVLFTEWQTEPTWQIASLPPGGYTWQVKARNTSAESGWSSPRSLTIQEAAGEQPTVFSAPITISVESEADAIGWSTNGTWDLNREQNHTPGGSGSWKYDVSGAATSGAAFAPAGGGTGAGAGATNYDTGLPNSGYLTSPPITLPEETPHYLRFWYFYETEGPTAHWDQRWVQISVDGSPWTSLLQLFGDEPNFWLRSPAISLAEYAGHTVQMRFYFVTLDSAFNNFRGWYIDDIAISAGPPPACEIDSDNTPEQALPLALNSSVQAVICPGSDIDFYRFEGQAGQQIGAWVDAQRDTAQDFGERSSPLDSVLALLDSDGRSILAENDDLITGELTDSWVYYRLPHSGVYYLKVRAWDMPTSGGQNYTYTLNLHQDDQDPSAAWIFPSTGGGMNAGPFTLQVQAGDVQSGVSRVEFLWHSSDWQNSDWIVLGQDWDGSDGWSHPFDPSILGERTGTAFYARIYDWGGNWIGTGAWNLRAALVYFPFIPKGR